MHNFIIFSPWWYRQALNYVKKLGCKDNLKDELESAAKTANEAEEPQKPEKRRIKLSDIPIWQAAVDRIKKDDSKPKVEKKVKEEKKQKKEKQKKSKEGRNAADQQ